MIVCVRIARFELVVAAGGPEALSGRPLALAPGVGGSSDKARVGEVSGAAEGFGVRAGMALGEALARCPQLGLVAPDPIAVAAAWEQAARALEAIGADVELERPGIAYFGALHGGLDGVLAATRAAAGPGARLGVAPTRFCALAASLRARARRPAVVTGGPLQARTYLAPVGVELLALRARTAPLVEVLTRLGILTLGELARLPRDAVADRLGLDGSYAQTLARGGDVALHTRRVETELEERLELDEAASGLVLERGLRVLVDRLLARPQRRGRTLRACVLSATLAGDGSWRERVVFREALSDPRRLVLALSGRLALLPSPVDVLRLAVEQFGPACGEQGLLLDGARAGRAGSERARARLREAVDQVRALAGPDAALRTLCVEPDSRVPERRVMLTPFRS